MHLYKYIVIHFSEAIFLSEKSIFICITQHLPWFNPAVISKREIYFIQIAQTVYTQSLIFLKTFHHHYLQEKDQKS